MPQINVSQGPGEARRDTARAWQTVRAVAGTGTQEDNEERAVIPHTINKTLLASDPDQARAQLEELSGAQGAKDKAAGARLRAVAVELVRRGLQVALVDYLDGWTELEATWPQAPHL